MNEVIKQLKERKSVRSYTDQEISSENKKMIIEAAINAPTAGNMQLYSIIDITKQTIKNQLAILCDNQAFIKEAKMVLIFCADYQKWYNAFSDLNLNPRKPQESDLLLAIEDALIAAQNSVTAAQSLNIGSCYIGDIMENHDQVVELLKLPKYVYPACMLVFGYPTKQQTERKKPQRVDTKYVLFENEYQLLNSDELKDMFKYKALGNDYDVYMKKFLEIKYNSKFCEEMAKSCKQYLKEFE